MKTGGIKQTRGFTLLELMVAVTIGALLLGIGVPAFQTTIADQRSTAITNELIQTLILARSEAIKRGQYVSVCKSSSGTACTGGSDWEDGWIVFSNESSATPNAVNAGDEIIRVYQAADGTLDIGPSGNIGAFISFRPVGTTGTTALNFAGTLTMCHEHDLTPPRGLIISPSGRMQVSRDEDHAGSALSCA